MNGDNKLSLFKKPQGISYLQSNSNGFDNPLVAQKDDRLEREDVANHAYSYLTNLDANWSVRVGLIAPWGEGKTTISEWVAARAKTDGHIAVWWRNPWAAQSDAELWLGFYTALTTALCEQGIEFKSSAKHIIAGLSAKDWAKGASAAHAYAQAGLGFVQGITRITADDIQKLKAILNGKRVIVIIDDLDRVDATLIPRLLMSVRDVMNVEGFSFLLPFDERVVSEALSVHIQAEGYGERFLEKILDYRVYLYPPTKEQTASLFYSELKEHCPFINIEMIDGVEEYLPSNPRKLKALARGLKLYSGEGERHRPEEISWMSVIFAQMIKMESEAFFQLFDEDTFGERERRTPVDTTARNPWMHFYMEEDKDKAKKSEQKRIEDLLDMVGVKVPEIRERLIEICDGWRSTQGYWQQHKIVYALRLLYQPEALTWAEFDEAWDIWSREKNLEDLTQWIQKHAENVKKESAEIACELFKTTIQRYDEYLERAINVLLQSDHDSCIDDALQVFELIDLIIENSFPHIPQDKTLGIETFKSFYGICSKWAHFEGNVADQEQRAKEKEALKKWSKKVNTNGGVVPYTVFLKNLGRTGLHEKQAAQLRDAILSEFHLDGDSGALKALETSGTLESWYPYEAGAGTKDWLLDVESDLWMPIENSPALKVFEKAAENKIIQINAYEFLNLLGHVCNEGAWGIERTDVLKFYEQPQIIAKIWEAAIATPFQFRALSSLREMRTRLISRDIDESLLPIPDWLKDNN